MKKELTVIEQNGCCSPLTPPRSTEKERKLLASFFAALSDQHRLAILEVLAQNPEPVCVCDIVDTFPDLTQPTISHHLKTLRQAELVEGNRQGKWVYYSIIPEKLEALKAVLSSFQPARMLVVV
jgi:ArsR family transcriptional regulator, arsenate/arsenite/antimonite-responsive transcriptional repressor